MEDAACDQMRLKADRLEELQRTLREMESRYLALESSVADPCVVYDLRGNALRVNACFESTFGWTRDELLGRSIPYVPDDQQDASMESIRAALAGNPFPLRARRLTKSGRHVNVVITRVRFVDATGAAAGHIAVAHQVPRRDRTPQLLSGQVFGPQGQLSCIDCTLRMASEQGDSHVTRVKEAIRLLIELVQTHKMELQERMRQNLNTSVLPLIAYLKASDLSPSQRNLVDTLDFTLAHMASCFGTGFSQQDKRLSPRETQICGLIVSGQDSRAIAERLGLTYQTVIVHRKNIRRKLGLHRNKQNLESYIREKMPREA